MFLSLKIWFKINNIVVLVVISVLVNSIIVVRLLVSNWKLMFVLMVIKNRFSNSFLKGLILFLSLCL